VACLNTGEEAPLINGLVTSVGWEDRRGRACYEVEGSAFHSGFTVKWLSERFKDPVGWASPMDRSPLPASDRVYILPSFTQMGAPRWPTGRGAAITGLGMDATARDMIRGALEAMVFQAHDLFVAMGGPSDSSSRDVAVDGGGAANDYVCQLLADLLRRTVVRPVLAEVTSIGAAKAALGGVGEDVPRYFAQDRSRATRFLPGRDPSYALEGYERWVELLQTLLA
jgi:glycerol kinase